MTKRLAIPSKDLQLTVVGPRDKYPVARVQKLSFNTTVPSETKDELGNPLHVGETKDTPEITATFNAFDVGVKIFSALTGTDPNAYPALGVDTSKLGEIDVIAYAKDDEVNDYVKSIHGKRLQIRDFTFNYSVGGDSTEEYTAVGSERRYFKYDVVVDKFTSGTTTFTLTETPIALKNGDNAISVILDGKYLAEVTGTPATGEYRLVGKNLTTGDARTSQVMVVYHANPAGNNWTDIGDSTMPVAIRGKDVSVEIAANGIPRVQSITINGNLNIKAVEELGTRGKVGYQSQNQTVEGTITVLDTDTDLISLFTTGVVGSGVEWAPGEGCTDTELDLKIELLNPCDTDAPIEVMKTVYLPKITLVGDSYTANVNDNASVTYNWKSSDAQCIIYSGSM